MNVGIDARHLKKIGMGGLGIYILNLAKYLSKNQIECVLFCRKNHYIIDDPNVKTVDLFKEKIGIPLSDLYQEKFILPKLIKKYKINLYHAAANFGLPRLEIPSILTIHDIIPLTIKEHLSFFEKNLYFYSLKNSIKNASAIITISNFTKKDLTKKIKEAGKKNIQVIYNGFDQPNPEKNQTEINKILQKFKIKSPYIIYIGGLHERKNIARLIRAFSKFLKAKRDYQLVITGKNSGTSYLAKMFKKYKAAVLEEKIQSNVIFTDYLTKIELDTLLAESNMFIYPSLYEGFGLPLLEAMALKVPSISSNTASLPEVGKNAALFVNPLDIDEIAGAILKLSEDENLRSSLINKGLERIKDFSWEKTGYETLELYKSCIFPEKH